jgi:hypothetical protein
MMTEDDDVGSTEYWRDIKQARQEKRSDNRENSAAYLRDRGIPFVEKNMGAHLIVEGRECFIDFWPGTGKWHSRCGKKGFGVRNLVAFIGAPSNDDVTVLAPGKDNK